MRHIERLDVGATHQLRIRHDRRWVRVDEHDVVPEVAERLGSLGPRVVELAGLADHDGPRANQQDFFDVFAARHGGALARGGPQALAKMTSSADAVSSVHGVAAAVWP